jgi:hypothetical protein
MYYAIVKQMKKHYLQFLVVATLLITLVILAGCSSGSAPTQTGADTSPSTPSSSTSSSSPAPATSSSGTSAQTTAKPLPRPFEVKPNATPQFFIDSLKQKKPVLVFFYGNDTTSKKVTSEVKKVTEDPAYAAALIVHLLDIESSKEVTKLAEQFEVSFIPYLAVLDRNGQIVFEKTGYIDSKVIEQAVYSAVNK